MVPAEMQNILLKCCTKHWFKQRFGELFKMTQKYDYIIAGAGLAGLLLASELMDSPTLRNKKVLLLDKDPKDSNDRTWCLWCDEKFKLNHLVYRAWDKIRFLTSSSDENYVISPYIYKYIRGIDFYNFVRQKISQNPNYKFIQSAISEVHPNGIVIADGIEYQGELVFNSLHPSFYNFKYPKNCYYLLQHFKGYFIETKEDTFDTSCATFMDFNIEQHKEARFGYVLPFSKREALVEYTLFSKELLPKEEYEKELRSYIKDDLKIQNYIVKHEEFGIVPMSTYSYEPKMEGKVIRIGTYGGFVKPSSGFAFSRTFKRIQKIVADLENDGTVKKKSLESAMKYKFYDNILLSILEKDALTTRDIFEKMFTKMDAYVIFKFLDEESSLWEDIRVMSLFLTDKRFLSASVKEIARMVFPKS